MLEWGLPDGGRRLAGLGSDIRSVTARPTLYNPSRETRPRQIVGVAAHPSRGPRPGNRRRATPHVRCAVAPLRDRSRIPAELGENRAAATKQSKPWRGGQPLLCPTSKRLLVTPHSFALEIEMLYERRLAVIFRSSVASIKLRFSSRE